MKEGDTVGTTDWPETRTIDREPCAVQSSEMEDRAAGGAERDRSRTKMPKRKRTNIPSYGNKGNGGATQNQRKTAGRADGLWAEKKAE